MYNLFQIHYEISKKREKKLNILTGDRLKCHLKAIF